MDETDYPNKIISKVWLSVDQFQRLREVEKNPIAEKITSAVAGGD